MAVYEGDGGYPAAEELEPGLSHMGFEKWRVPPPPPSKMYLNFFESVAMVFALP
jgi:hypothetical protein